MIANNYEFPSAKPKRQSYEYYNPRNILKRNWMLKHLHVLPSCIVLFQDIEWNDPQWAEKQKQCASQIQQLKNSLQVRIRNKTKLIYHHSIIIGSVYTYSGCSSAKVFTVTIKR